MRSIILKMRPDEMPPIKGRGRLLYEYNERKGAMFYREEVEAAKRYALYNEGHKEEGHYVMAGDEKLFNPWVRDGRQLSDAEAVEAYGLDVVMDFVDGAVMWTAWHERMLWKKLAKSLETDLADERLCEVAVYEYKRKYGSHFKYACTKQ